MYILLHLQGLLLEILLEKDGLRSLAPGALVFGIGIPLLLVGHKCPSSVPSGPIAVGDVTGDERADVVSCWASGLWYQNGSTLGWTKVYSMHTQR